nr:unnamed protein product [Spirometra erinaceieuropaei]
MRRESPNVVSSCTDLIGHLRIHRTEASEPVPGTPTHTRHIHLHCPHCPRTFTHRRGAFGHLRIHDSGIDRSLDAPSISCSSTLPSPTHTPPPSTAPISNSTTATNSEIDANIADYSCPHCPRTFASCTGLVGHLRIHRTETGEPVTAAPTFTITAITLR